MMVVERRRNLGRHLGRLAQRRLLEFGRQILLHEIDRRLGMRQHSGQPSGQAAGEPRETAFHLAERLAALRFGVGLDEVRSEEHTSELQSLMRISYAVFCLKKKKTQHNKTRP